MKKQKTVMGAVSMLLNKVDRGFVKSHQLDHVTDVIMALSENPDAVTVKSSLLDEVWKRIDWYLKVDKGGFLLVILNPEYWKKKDQIRRRIADLGVEFNRIRLIQPTLDIEETIGLISTRECRMVLFSKECPKKVIGSLGSKPASGFPNINLIRGALVSLSEQVK